MLNGAIRSVCPRIEQIVDDVQTKVQEMKFEPELRPLVQTATEDHLSGIVAYTHDLNLPAGRREGRESRDEQV